MSLINELYVLTFLVGLIFWWVTKSESKVKNELQNVPGPPLKFFFGNALELNSTKVILHKLSEYHEEYGSIFKVKIGPLRLLLVIADHSFLEFLFNNNKMIGKSLEYRFLSEWLGNGLLTSKGTKWKKHRRMITPAFHFQITEQFIDAFERSTNILIRKLESEVGNDTFNVYSYITLNSLDIICESTMGTSVNAQEEEESDYVYSVKEMCRIMMDRTTSPIKMYDFLFRFSRDYYKQERALKVLHNFSRSVIVSRRKELSNHSSNIKNQDATGMKNRTAFLDILIGAEDVDGTKLTDEEIREEVDTFMFEGHDTTSSGVSFALYCLSNHPDEQNKVIQEQICLFGNEKNPRITFQDLQDMKYLELVIKETLRLYPSVPLYGRTIEEDIEYGNYTLPKGLTLIVNTYAMQRSCTYFHNPEKFDPERHADSTGRPLYSYVPFSAGSRNCIGQKFAMLEMKYVISKILRNFKLLPAIPEHKVILLSETILKSENGIHIKIENRI